MELVKAKCTECGATLDVNPNAERLTCRYCGSEFIVEKAISVYNQTTVNNVTNNINAEQVIINNDASKVNENLITTAVNEMKNGQYKEAGDHFDLVVINDATNIDAPFFRAYCRCYNITLGQMPNAAINFTNAFCLYMDNLVKIDDEEERKAKADFAVKLLTTLVNMYSSNARRTMLTAPTVGYSISSAAKNMNTTCMNKLRGSNISISENTKNENDAKSQSNSSSKAWLFILIAIGAIAFIVSMIFIYI